MLEVCFRVWEVANGAIDAEALGRPRAGSFRSGLVLRSIVTEILVHTGRNWSRRAVRQLSRCSGGKTDATGKQRWAGIEQLELKLGKVGLYHLEEAEKYPGG